MQEECQEWLTPSSPHFPSSEILQNVCAENQRIDEASFIYNDQPGDVCTGNAATHNDKAMQTRTYPILKINGRGVQEEQHAEKVQVHAHLRLLIHLSCIAPLCSNHSGVVKFGGVVGLFK